VHIAGWYVSTELALVRKGGRRVLLDLLADLARNVDVRVLLWAGAPLPLFRPSRGDVRDVAEHLRGAGVQVALDAKERPLHCHHEKLVVVDDRAASVGGIDLTTINGDRYDSSDHPWHPALGWHDAGALVRGPVVADAAEHFRFRWREVAGRGQVGVLADAGACAGRFLACALYARDGAVREPIYVHAKIGIVDDRWLTIGSANLNEHSLFNDTEVNLVSCEPELARATRERLWAEHLELPVEEVRGREPAELVDERWYAIAEEQLDRRNRGE